MDTETLLQSFGYLIIFLSVFIECGVLLGLILPLPGFSLLFTAGVFASQSKLNFYAIILVGVMAAILGYIVGYYTGSKYGRKLFYSRENKKYFTRKQGEATEKFMKKYGYSTLIIGRFLPLIHNLAPLMSGLAKTPIIPFMIANVVGAIIWVVSAATAGFFIGQYVPYAQYIAIPFVIATFLFGNSRYGKRLASRLNRTIENA